MKLASVLKSNSAFVRNSDRKWRNRAPLVMSAFYIFSSSSSEDPIFSLSERGSARYRAADIRDVNATWYDTDDIAVSSSSEEC